MAASTRATASCGRFLVFVLAAHDLAGFFDAVRVRLPGDRDKPQMHADLLASLGTTGRGGVVVGDRADDVEAAHANGLRAVGCAYGYGVDGELDGAEVVVGTAGGDRGGGGAAMPSMSGGGRGMARRVDGSSVRRAYPRPGRRWNRSAGLRPPAAGSGVSGHPARASRTLFSMASVAHASTLRVLASDIKLHHSVFALPFAVLAAFMAARPDGGAVDWRRFGGQLVLVVLAMVFARTVAMLANRLLDRGIDRENPRTAGRALPSGRVTAPAAAGVLAACAAAFAAVCAAFGFLYGNWWPAALTVPVLAWLAAYPLLKRFTWLCHFYLGSALALSPPAAALAVDPKALAQPAVWLLSGMVLCWVAGFDVIYALQDVDIDRRLGHHSAPARLGVAAAMRVSRALHATAVLFLAAAARLDARFGWLFGAGVALVAALLVYEHLTVARWGMTRLALAFFGLNGIISCVLGVLGVADVLIGG